MFDSPVEAVHFALSSSIRAWWDATLIAATRAVDTTPYLVVHLGDVIVEPDGVFLGDGVNIAARLEGLRRPGDLFISGGVYEQIKNKLVCAYQSLGRPPSQEHYRSGKCLSRPTGPRGPKPGKKAALASWAACRFGYRSDCHSWRLVPFAPTKADRQSSADNCGDAADTPERQGQLPTHRSRSLLRRREGRPKKACRHLLRLRRL